MRQFLGKLVLRSEEVMRIQSLNMTKNQEPVKSKSKPFSRFIPNETSALSVSIPKSKAKGIKTKRPCTFCNKDHWDNECQVYSTVKQRTKRLKELKACLNCFDNSHKAKDCKSRKRSCFYRKGPHNTALCEEKYQGHNESNKEEAKSVNVNITNKNQTDQREKEVLLLCRKVNVINPVNQEIQSEAIVLFDTGAQTSFVSKKLAQKLKLEVGESGIMRIASFSNKYSTSSPYYTTTNWTYQVFQLDRNLRCVERPDILIGADYFSQFIPFKQCQVIRSGFSLINTKVGPILAGSGDATRPPKFTGMTTTSSIRRTISRGNREAQLVLCNGIMEV
ncbi:unnamed protein product [Dracunculus medinensis]|uniref:DUF1758 domain-containing protein n=1 Tax=Dracunculus medinensis TaxID=318479 RepID=A0A3P7QW54_DRAME|nr:unnamed protein product [Dracunculus medinensis]